MTDEPLAIVRKGLEDAAATFGLMEGVYRDAKEAPMADLMRAARNRATAALERAGFPQED